MLKRTLSLILSLLLAFCIGCNKDTGTPAKSPTQTAFDKFTDEIFTETVSDNTINLHFTLAYPENYSLSGTPATLGEFGYDYMSEEISHINALYKRLCEFPYDELTAKQQLTYDILKDSLQSEIDAGKYILFNEALSPLTGYQAQLPVLLANYTFRCKEDVENYLALLANFDEYFNKIMEFEKLKSENGYFMPDFMAHKVISQCMVFIEDIEKNYLIETFDSAVEELDFLSKSEKDAFRAKNIEYIKSDVVAGYESIINGLTALLGSGKNDAGLYYHIDGTDYYSHLVRCQTGSSKSVSSLKALTADYIEESLQKIYSLMINDASLVDELDNFSFKVTEPNEILNFLKESINTDFPALSDAAGNSSSGGCYCKILSVHKSLEQYLSPAFFIVPPVDDSFNNVIYINNYYSNVNLFTTLAHEGYPGHLYQHVYAAQKSLPLIRNMLNYPGYIEGWATYAEYYSYYISGLSEKLADVLVLNDSATLGIYAYLDMAIHYDGWEYEDVCEYLSIFGLNDKELALDIYETIIENPAEYLSYFIGYMEIMELKEEAMEMLGDAFTPKKFHTFLLDIGPAPYDIISEYMKAAFTQSESVTE